VPKDNTLRPPRSGPSIGSERGCFTPSARYKDEVDFDGIKKSTSS
jgi:hypothetical protein